MTITLRRTAAALMMPAVLMLTLTACGEDEASTSSDSSSETTESSAPEAEETPTEEAPAQEAPSEEPTAPTMGDVPDPTKDPEAFKDYVAKAYTDAGMSEEQANCMADAFVDNVDLSSINDPSAVGELMNDSKLQSAMMECV